MCKGAKALRHNSFFTPVFPLSIGMHCPASIVTDKYSIGPETGSSVAVSESGYDVCAARHSSVDGN